MGKNLTMDEVCELKGVDGEAGCSIWIADRIDGDSPPSIDCFVTGCTSEAKALKYLSCEEVNATGRYAAYNWKTGRWL